jgi:glucosamine kinase
MQHAGTHGLGFILGDEGSGNWFGKVLITDFLYGEMPYEVHTLFENTYELSKDVVMQNIYQKPAANAYLASFARFLNVIRRTQYGQDLLKKGFLEFVETNVKSYPQYHDHKCHFVGSIAYTFAPELSAVCKSNGVHVGKIIKQPIHDLLTFILSREAL